MQMLRLLIALGLSLGVCVRAQTYDPLCDINDPNPIPDDYNGNPYSVSSCSNDPSWAPCQSTEDLLVPDHRAEYPPTAGESTYMNNQGQFFIKTTESEALGSAGVLPYIAQVHVYVATYAENRTVDGNVTLVFPDPNRISRSVFYPEVDKFARLDVLNTHPMLRNAKNVWTWIEVTQHLGANGTMTFASDPHVWISNSLFAPYLSAYIELRRGYITRINWDENEQCNDCFDGGRGTCLDGFCGLSLIEAFQASESPRLETDGACYTAIHNSACMQDSRACCACDLKIYLGWTGTDGSDALYEMRSAKSFPSRFRKFSSKALAMFVQASELATDAELLITENLPNISTIIPDFTILPNYTIPSTFTTIGRAARSYVKTFDLEGQWENLVDSTLSSVVRTVRRLVASFT